MPTVNPRSTIDPRKHNQSRRIEILNQWLEDKGRPELAPDGFCNGDATLFQIYAGQGNAKKYTELTEMISSLNGYSISAMEDKHQEYQSYMAYRRESQKPSFNASAFYAENPNLSRNLGKYTEEYLADTKKYHEQFLEISQYYSQILFLFEPEKTVNGLDQYTYTRNMNFVAGNTIVDEDNPSKDNVICPDPSDVIVDQLKFSFDFGNEAQMTRVYEEIIDKANSNKMMMLLIDGHAMSLFYDASTKNYHFLDPNSSQGIFESNDFNIVANYILSVYAKDKHLELTFHVLDDSKPEHELGVVDKQKIIDDMIKQQITDTEALIVTLRHSMHAAIRNDDIDTVKIILTLSEQHPELKDQILNAPKKTEVAILPINYAAKANKPEMLALLIEHGATINPQGPTSPTSISQLRGHVDCIKLLVEKGASPSIDILELDEAILIAAKENNLEAIKYLDTLEVTDELGLGDLPPVETLDFDSASESIPSVAVGTLPELDLSGLELVINGETISGSKPQKTLMPNEKALIEAASHGHLDIVKYMVEIKKVRIDESALVKAIQNKHPKTLKYLVDNVNLSEVINNTQSVPDPNKPASTAEKTLLEMAIDSKEFESVKLLISNGANLPSISSQIQIMQLAATENDLAFIQTMSTQDLNIEAKKAAMLTAEEMGNTDIIRFMNSQQKIPYTVDDLVASVKGCIKNGDYAILNEILTSVGINEKSTQGETALTVAAANGDQNLTRFLIEHCKANINVPDETGKPPLIKAIKDGQNHLVALLMDSGAKNLGFDYTAKHVMSGGRFSGRNEMRDFMRQWQKYDATAVDMMGQTPLMWAAKFGDLALVEELLSTLSPDEKTSALNHKDKMGNTVLQIANTSKHPEITEILVNNGATASMPRQESSQGTSLNHRPITSSFTHQTAKQKAEAKPASIKQAPDEKPKEKSSWKRFFS